MTPDHHSLHDELLRQRLAELPEPPASAAGWERLASDLAVGAADAVRFDESIQSALTQPTESGLAPAAGWSLLADRLDRVGGTSPADAHVADQLRSLVPASAPAAGWDRLHRQLDADDAAATDLVDAAIARQLAVAEPVKVSGWAGLAARLELIGQRRELIAALKVTELCLLLSFLLLALHPNGPGSYLRPAAAIDDFPIAMQPAAELTPEGEASVEVGIGAVTAPAEPTMTEPNSTATGLPVVSVPSAAVEKETTTAKMVTGTSVSLEKRPGAIDPTTTVRKELQSIPTVHQLDYAINLRSITPAPALQLEPVSTGPQMKYYFNLFYSPFDFNEVITRETYYREIYTIDGERRFTYGHSAGALVEAVRGNTGVQFGMIYGKRSYIPTQLKWFSAEESGVEFGPVEPFSGGYSRLIYNSITLPLHFTQTVLRRPNWTVTARVGAGVNVILKSSFYTEDGDELSVQELIQNSSPFLDQNEGAGRAKSTEGDVYDLANPEPGYFQGGGLLSNSRFEIGGGIRVERMLGDGVSIYVAPSFGRTLYITPEAGLGPYFDRVHTYNFRFGSRFLLGKK